MVIKRLLKAKKKKNPKNLLECGIVFLLILVASSDLLIVRYRHWVKKKNKKKQLDKIKTII